MAQSTRLIFMSENHLKKLININHTVIELMFFTVVNKTSHPISGVEGGWGWILSILDIVLQLPHKRPVEQIKPSYVLNQLIREQS